MPNLQCNVCNQLFTGDDASEDIKEHLFTCAVTTIITKEESHLFQRLKQRFPVIAKIEYAKNEDVEQPDFLCITRQDGTTYRVAYRYGFAFPRSKREEEPFDVANLGIAFVEGLIADIIDAVKEQVPHADIHFTGVRENTGYLGNGYHFSFTSNGETNTLTHYKNEGTVSQFVEKIVSFYTTEIRGVLTKFNEAYTINGVSVNQWLLNHVGKDVCLKENEEKINN